MSSTPSMTSYFTHTASRGLCEDSTWTYHEHTVTCVKLFDSKVTYTAANHSCSQLSGGPSGDQPGWLVGVHDSTTDAFLQTLLNRNQKVFIGMYRGKDEWEWVDGNPLRSTYTGWKNGSTPPTTDNNLGYVILTEDGWENARSDYRYGFVCQMYPAFPPPMITCPPSEEGKFQEPIECTVNHHSSYGSLKRLLVSNDIVRPVVQCNSLSSTCASFLDDANGAISKENKEWKTTVIVERPTRRADNHVNWLCGPEFEKTFPSFLAADCTMHTFVIPESVNCTQTMSPSDGVLVVCNVHGVFPEAKKVWSHYIDGERRSEVRLNSEPMIHEVHTDDGLYLYNYEFSNQFKALGQHKIDITVYPNVPFITEEARLNASVERTVEFIICVPDQPPVFSTENDLYINQDRLTVMEGQAVTLVCEVNGGSPQVRQISIQCVDVRDSSKKIKWDDFDQKIRVEISVTRDMDQMVCTCRAEHVTQEYMKTASVTLNVPHAAEIDSFTVNNESVEVEVYESNMVTLRCSAQGNPPPQLHLYRFENDGIQKTLKKASNTSVTYDIAEATCDMSGTYVCSAESCACAGASERRVNVKVRCPPQPCNHRPNDREFSIVPGNAFNFQICVYMYPRPRQTPLVFRKSELEKNSYRAEFVHTNAVETQGYVAVDINSSVTQLGKYALKLYQSSWHAIEFSLVPNQVPSCPESLNTVTVASRFIVFSWQPISDRGNPQTFTLSTTDSGEIVKKEDFGDDGENPMSHNVTDLDPGSAYTFSLSVKNEIGVTNCPHLTVIATTQGQPDSVQTLESKTDGKENAVCCDYLVVGMALSITIAVIMAVILVIMALKYWRQKKRMNKHSFSVKDKQTTGETPEEIELMYAQPTQKA